MIWIMEIICEWMLCLKACSDHKYSIASSRLILSHLILSRLISSRLVWSDFISSALSGCDQSERDE